MKKNDPIERMIESRFGQPIKINDPKEVLKKFIAETLTVGMKDLGPQGKKVNGDKALERDWDDGDVVKEAKFDVKAELSTIMHDYSDEYGWDEIPSVQYLMDELADHARKEGFRYDRAEALKYAEEIVKRNQRPKGGFGGFSGFGRR